MNQLQNKVSLSEPVVPFRCVPGGAGFVKTFMHPFILYDDCCYSHCCYYLGFLVFSFPLQLSTLKLPACGEAVTQVRRSERPQSAERGHAVQLAGITTDLKLYLAASAPCSRYGLATFY